MESGAPFCCSESSTTTPLDGAQRPETLLILPTRYKNDIRNHELNKRYRNQSGHFSRLQQARLAVFDFIEGFYNPRRRHSAIGYLSPVNF